MRHFKILAASMGAALLVAACGGGGGSAGDQTPKVKFSSMVSFGDSLSDVGTYKVGAIANAGGGMYTVNGITGAIGADPAPSKNWTELIAAQLGQSAPCPAQTGLNGNATQGLNVAVVNHAGCLNYAQGGSRVTNADGAHSVLRDPTLGQLTVPVLTQITNHLATTASGSFSGSELVTVLAGGNDVLVQLDDLSAAATAAGKTAFATSLVTQLAAGATSPSTAAPAIGLALQTEAARAGSTDTSVVTAAVTAAVIAGNTAAASPAVYGPMVATAQAAGTAAGNTYAATTGAVNAVTAMGAAGAQLAAYIKTQIVGKGAKYVAVVNLPDVSKTPKAYSQSVATQGLINTMVVTFNTQLTTGLAGTAGVIIVDAYSDNRNQAVNPASYALTNVTSPACNLATPSPNLTGSSLTCNTSNVNTGDVSHYLFADTVHPTPYGYKLLAQLVTKSLVLAGWL